MKKTSAILLLTALSATVAYAAFYSEPEDFTNNWSNGDPLVGDFSKGTWTSVNAIVTNETSIGVNDDWAAYFGEGSSGTNAIAEDGPLSSRVWTDFRIKPACGGAPTVIPSGVQTLFFFDTEGYIQYRDDGNWVTASNNIFGESVTSLTNAAVADNWQRVSVFQDYAAKTYAILLNDVVIAQDIPFVNTGTSYQRFTLDNAQNEAFLDGIRIYNSLPSGLDANNNVSLNAMADAEELDTIGYVARTLTVDDTFTDPSAPQFTEISDALAVYRSNDLITVADGSYAAITVTNDITLTGAGFTVASITVTNGATLTLPYDVVVSSGVTVEAGSTLVAQGALAAASTAIAGTVNVGNNTLTVSGLVDLSASGGNIQIGASGTLDAGSITMVSGTQIASAGGALVNTLLSMTGTFTIEGTNWNPASAMAKSLPFTDDFERYNHGQTIQNLKLFGWDANDSSVMVTNSVAAAGSSKSVILPDGTELTLSISGTDQPRVWTDFYLRPALGVGPDIATTADKGFSCFVDDNGDLNAAMVDGGTTNWVALNARASWGGAAPVFTPDSFTNQFSATTFTRVSVYQNYSNSTYSVFIGTTNLVAIAEQFPAPNTAYSTFMAENSGTDAYLDEMRVIATLPFAPDDDTVDINGNGMDDREEIHWYGDLNTYIAIRGSLFRFI